METNDTNTEITRWVLMRGTHAAGHPMYEAQAYNMGSYDSIEAAMEAAEAAAEASVTARLEADAEQIQKSLRNFGKTVAPAAAPVVERGVFEMTDMKGEVVQRRGITVTSRQNSIALTTSSVFWVEGRR